MEASETSGDQAQDAGQTDATGQEQEQPAQDPTPQEQPAQEQPAQDPAPQEESPASPPIESAPDPAPAQPVESAPDPVADEAQRQSELEAQRREHAERTGGGEVQPNELQNQRQEHNDRTGGGQVPGADSSES